MRFLQRPPLHRHRRCAFRYKSRSSWFEVATPRTRAVHAVSHSFDGLTARRFAGLLHPATDHGVRLVSCRCVHGINPQTTRHSPQALDPLERFPPCEVVTVTAPSLARSPIDLPLSPFCCFPLCKLPKLPAALKPLAASGVSPRPESVAAVPRCRVTAARCSYGLVPTLGLSPIEPACDLQLANQPKLPFRQPPKQPLPATQPAEANRMHLRTRQSQTFSAFLPPPEGDRRYSDRVPRPC